MFYLFALPVLISLLSYNSSILRYSQLQKSTSEFTFCLKEFKALLGFCEAMNSSISIYFQQGGLPILLSNR